MIMIDLSLIIQLFLIFLFQYAIFLAILLFFELSAGILAFVFKDWVRFYKSSDHSS